MVLVNQENVILLEAGVNKKLLPELKKCTVNYLGKNSFLKIVILQQERNFVLN